MFWITDQQIDNAINKFKNSEDYKKISNLRKDTKNTIFILRIISIPLFLLSLIFSLEIIFTIVVFVYSFVKYLSVEYFNMKVKSLLKKEYIQEIDKDLKYSKWPKLFPYSIREIVNMSHWLLDKDANVVRRNEDSIMYKKNGVEVFWMDIETAEYSRRNNGKERSEVTSDNAYIVYTKLLNHRFPFKDYILIKKKPWIIINIINYIMIFIVHFFIILLLAIVSISVPSIVLLWVIAISNSISPGILPLICFEDLFNFNLEDTNKSILVWLWQLFSISMFLGFFYEGLSSKKEKEVVKKVKLEDPKFQRMFEVLSPNEIEARRLLTPKMMKYLVDLQTKIKHNLGFCFTKNEVFLKIDYSSTTYNWLEISINKPPETSILLFFKEIQQILAFLNYINIEYFQEIKK